MLCFKTILQVKEQYSQTNYNFFLSIAQQVNEMRKKK